MPLDSALFLKHMETDEPYAVLLKGHLWIESCLNSALDVLFVHPEVINVDKQPFSRKIDLAFALGFLDEGEANTLRLLNRMRNRLAHELNGEPSASDFAALNASLTGAMKQGWEVAFVDESIRGTLTPYTLVGWFRMVLMILEYKVMARRYERDNHQALATYRLIRAIDEEIGGNTPDQVLRERHGVPPRPHPSDAWINDEGVVSSKLRFTRRSGPENGGEAAT